MGSNNDDFNKTNPIAVIRSILDGYPFGVGIFREFLQNSDDARASKQIFLLDNRCHSPDAIYHGQLKNTQGPALIAYNDANFLPTDWESLQAMYQSSKKKDTSKIGKYGIGFRSCYHITDFPQVLSGDAFAIFDPQNHFADKGGVKMAFSEVPQDHRCSLNTNWFSRSSLGHAEEFAGTIIRLPLRTDISEISKRVTAAEILQLLHEFIDGELNIALLFLAKLQSIDIYVINDGDRTPQLVASTNVKSIGIASQTWIRHITTTLRDGISQSQEWRVLHFSSDSSECARLISGSLGSDAQPHMSKEKLTPDIALAISLPVSDSGLGRLFTYLPLPLPTGYPCHIHGLFALDQSRQNLRNSHETGLVPGSSDSFRVEWNRLLCSTLIPRAWLKLLCILVEQDNVYAENIFLAWPHLQPSLSDLTCVPMRLLDEVASSGKAVWPVLPYSGGTCKYFPLKDVLVASDQDDTTFSDQLASLALAGVWITQVPQHMYDLMNGKTGVVVLTPITVQRSLLSKTKELAVMPRVNLDHILSYLLSSGRLENIINLPLVPCVDGRNIFLTERSFGCTLHVLQDAQAESLFSSLDPSAISLSKLPPIAQNLFMRGGELLLNVKSLSCDTVTKYLDLAFRKFGIHVVSLTPIHSSQVSAEALEWFTGFWGWLSSWTSRRELYASLESLPSLPTSVGGLQCPRNGVFPSIHDDNLRELLQEIGIPFIFHPPNQAVQAYLRDQGSIRQASNVPDLLHHIRPNDVALLDGSKVTRLRNHLVASNRGLRDDDRMRLRDLPIFSRLRPCATEKGEYSVACSLEPVAEDEDILCVSIQIVLPLLDHVFYISDLDLQLASLLKPDVQPLSEVRILQKAVENFPAQPEEWQYRFLLRLSEIREQIPPKLLDDLRSCQFIRADNDILYSPSHIFDPDSPVADLFLHNDSRLLPPRMPKTFVDALRRLNLLNRDLTIELCRERIQFVATQRPVTEHTTSIAEKLLLVMESEAMDYTDLRSVVNVAWLPTNQGILCSPSDCRDIRDECLCKGVLPLLTNGMEIQSTTLRKVLGLDVRVPLDVILKRIKNILADDDPPAFDLHRLILEFGFHLQTGHLDDGIILELGTCTKDVPWVPISGSSRELSLAMFAVFDGKNSLPGFHRIRTSLALDLGSKAFLERMGCTRTPSNQAILRAIGSCKGPVKDVIVLLKALRAEELSQEERRTLKFVPDESGTLQAPLELFYNDLGIKADEVCTSDMVFSHREIDYDTAIKFGLCLLSSMEISPDESMHVDLAECISEALSQYTKEQAFLEFLSNAADAKASEFGIYLDETSRRHQPKDPVLLAPAMAQLWKEASLLIYNNEKFSEKDWKGILDISVGGKRVASEHVNVDSRDATIGRFGLGALSMFHFTEVAMIVSGNQVMFLDPTKNHIRGTKNKTCIRMPLARMKSLYPDHFVPLQNIFGFSADLDYYDGTIFQLPLRTETQAMDLENKPISTDFFKPCMIKDLIAGFYAQFAPSALLFIPKVRQIFAKQRSSNGQESTIWSVAVTARKDIGSQCDVSIEEVVINRSEAQSRPFCDKWHVLVENIHHDDISVEHHGTMSKARINNVTIGIAGLIARGDTGRYRVFFGVPIPTLTSLPVHLHGSFILSNDRRNVRFEDNGDGNEESQFNKYLLSQKVPFVYLRFLETWPVIKPIEKSKWWPPTNPTDVISRTVTDAIKHRFLTSGRLVCTNLAGSRISPASCVFLRSTSPVGVKKVLKLLTPQSVAECPHRVWSKDVPEVDNSYLANVLRNHQVSFRSLFSTRSIGIPEVADTVSFLKQQEENQLLIGLPLLPLANDSLAVFAKTGNPPFVYTWNQPLGLLREPLLPWSLFGSDHFLHPEVDATQMIDLSLNVSKLTGDVVVGFIESRFKRPGELAMTCEDQEWIQSLSQILNSLHFGKEALIGLPLVPTYSPQHDNAPVVYLSIDRCQKDDILVTNENFNCLPDLHLLERFGARFVKGSTFPPVFSPINFEYKFEAVLNFFGTMTQEDINDGFRKLKDDEHRRFARWIKEEVAQLPDAVRIGRKRKYAAPMRLRTISANLPVWEVIRPEGGRFVDSLAAAREIKMLPSSVKLSVARQFVRVSSRDGYAYAEHSATLKKLQVEQLDAKHFQTLLEFPLIMPMISSDYLTLLRYILLQSSVADPVPVPNANGRMVLPSFLYSRSVSLFLDIFSTPEQQDKLLHPRLTELEIWLTKFGLRDRLCFDSFLAIASAVHSENDGPNKSRRAALVYNEYNNLLYGFILGNASKWAQLDNLRFIPRNARRRTITSNIPFDDFAKPLPDVVSPAELLISEFEYVAWSQRALFRDEPSQQLTISNVSLGKPTIMEVILHLRVLSLRIAPSYPSNPQLIIDLTETYRWLSEQAEDGKSEVEALLDFHTEPLFLNVGDPTTNWDWVTAPNLVFGAPDDGDRRCVKRFLVGFRCLLLSAGACEIKKVVAPTHVRSIETEEALVKLRRSFIEMRNEGKLTDVVFETRDGKELFAHRAYLAVQSEYFRDLFTGSFKEARTSPIPIRITEYSKYDPTSLAIALDHMYTGEVPDDLDYEELCDLLKLSHYFNLEDLYEIVQVRLVDELTPSNYGELLELSRRFDNKCTLATKCEEYAELNAAALRRFGL